MTHKPQQNLEIYDLIIHNYMVDCGATNNITPLSVTRTIGLDYTRHYKVGEFILAIDSSSVLVYA